MTHATTLYHSIPITMSSVTPRDRMVVLELYADIDRDDPGFINSYTALPVLAIVTSQSHYYERERTGRGYDSGERTHKEMLENGWRYSGITPIQVELIVDHDESGPSVLSEVENENYPHKAVTCTWPTERDHKEFTPYLEQLQREFRDRNARSSVGTNR